MRSSRKNRLEKEDSEKIIARLRDHLVAFQNNGTLDKSATNSVRMKVLRNKCRRRVIDGNIDTWAYDDEAAAPILDLAAKGDPDASAVIRRFVAEHHANKEPLPPKLQAHINRVYLDEIGPKKWPSYHNRDTWLFALLDELVASGFKRFSRRNLNDKSEYWSASRLIAEAAKRANIKGLSVSNLEAIWQAREAALSTPKRAPRPPRPETS